MLQRRTLLAGIAAGAATSAARAETGLSELVLAVVPAENASGVSDRFAPFIAYLSQQIGMKVSLKIANDYAAVIEGQRAGNVQIGYYGPASFARARLTGVATDAFVFYVRANSPYKNLADLKGKNLGLVDPNSTSGYNMPLFALNKNGIPAADKYFAKVQTTGSHENALIALAQGTVDVAANWWNADDDSNLPRMLSKGMLKDAGGKTLGKDDFRVILKSDLIINSPTAYLTALPADLKAKIRQAYMDAPIKAKAAFDKLSDGKNLPWQAVDNAAYDDTIKLIQFVDALRKKTA